MPYGVAKEHGGDSPENVSRMERCVAHVVKQGHAKDHAIAICKASLFGKKKEKQDA